MTPRPCSRCGHETASTRKVRPDLCGPCYAGKPVGWWKDLPAVLARIGAASALLLATPAAADSFKITARGTQHCGGVLGELLGPRFEARMSIDMPSPDYGNDGTVWIESIEFRGASYTRSGDSFAITGWTEQNKRWFHVSIHGRTKGEKVKGTFHYLRWGSTCFAEGKVR